MARIKVDSSRSSTLHVPFSLFSTQGKKPCDLVKLLYFIVIGAFLFASRAFMHDPLLYCISNLLGPGRGTIPISTAIAS